ncbi:MAG: 6-pyruvoyl trahydropterin synthase family protein [Bacteroidales bacterium]
MKRIRVTKEFNFEIAHALWNYNGNCKNLHGHSYRLFVTVSGIPIQDENNPKNGMVIDFGDLKEIVNQEVVKPLDHAVILNTKAISSINLGQIEQLFDKKYIVNFQPTCENLVVDFAEKISKRLPEGVKLFSLKLHETASSFAEWYASDNE